MCALHASSAVHAYMIDNKLVIELGRNIKPSLQSLMFFKNLYEGFENDRFFVETRQLVISEPSEAETANILNKIKMLEASIFQSLLLSRFFTDKLCPDIARDILCRSASFIEAKSVDEVGLDKYLTSDNTRKVARRLSF